MIQHSVGEAECSEWESIVAIERAIVAMGASIAKDGDAQWHVGEVQHNN